MPIIVECDGGCGATAEGLDGFQKRGFLKFKYYCDKCVVFVDEFGAQRDKLHDDLAKRWKSGIKKMTTEFGKIHLKATLPDG